MDVAAQAQVFAGGRVQRIPVPGGDLVAEVAGQGPPVILWHGWTLDRRQWRAQAPLLADFTLIAVDRRGFGEASAPPGLGDEPDDVSRVAAALGLDAYALVGFSQGGKVALAHAAQRPAGLRRLVVIGAPIDDHLPAPPDAVPVPAMRALAAAGRLDDMRRLWLAHPLTAGDARGRAALAGMLSRYDGRDLVAPGAPLTVTLDDVARIAVPATALAGAEDTAARLAVVAALGQAGLGHAGLPGGLIAGGGHLAPIEAAAATNAALRRALLEP